MSPLPSAWVFRLQKLYPVLVNVLAGRSVTYEPSRCESTIGGIPAIFALYVMVYVAGGVYSFLKQRIGNPNVGRLSYCGSMKLQ